MPAHPPQYHLNLMVGDLVAQVALLRARVEELEEQLAARPPVPTTNVRPFPEPVEKVD